MSVGITIVAEGSNQRAPEIGDRGAIGLPDLGIKSIYDSSWDVSNYTFGWIESGLRSIDLITRQVADVREFLELNSENTIQLITEGDDDTTSEIDWDSVADFVPSPKPEFEPCRYRILDEASAGCIAFENTGEFECLVPGERQLSPEDKGNFIARLVEPSMIDDSIHNVGELLHPYEFLGAVREFIVKHQASSLIVSIEPVRKA